MNMEKYDVKELVEKIYELDVKVYEATEVRWERYFRQEKIYR